MIAAILAAAVVAAPTEPPAWLAGTWGQAKKNQTVTEMWLAPQDGAMAGVTLTTRPGGGAARAEYAKITREPAGLTYTAVVGTQPPVPFVAIPAEGGWLVFENKAHDFPQRVAYRRCDADLCAAIEGVVKGKLERQEWRYSRIAR